MHVCSRCLFMSKYLVYVCVSWVTEMSILYEYDSLYVYDIMFTCNVLLEQLLLKMCVSNSIQTF